MLQQRLACHRLSIALSLAFPLTGCSMCQDSCDYQPPVIGSTVGGATPHGGRAGSAISGEVLSGEAPVMTVADTPLENGAATIRR
jgi:hypothetical protein